MLSVSYTGKNAYSASKTRGVLRDGALGANRCYVLAHCAPPEVETVWQPGNLVARKFLKNHSLAEIFLDPSPALSQKQTI